MQLGAIERTFYEATSRQTERRKWTHLLNLWRITRDFFLQSHLKVTNVNTISIHSAVWQQTLLLALVRPNLGQVS